MVTEKTAALRLAELKPSRFRLISQAADGGSDLERGSVRVLNYRRDQSIRRISRKADVTVLLEDEPLARCIERSVEIRKGLQGEYTDLDDEGKYRQLYPFRSA